MARRESVPGERWAWVLAIAVGLTSAGSWVHRNSDAPADTRPVQTAPLRNAVEARPTDVTIPSALLRPLAVLAKEVGPEPLFWLKDPGKPALSEAYKVAPAAADGSSAPAPQYANCEQLAPTAFVPATSGFAPVGRWRAADAECGLISRVKQDAERRNIGVDIVVATLPDWVDSSLQWMFDPIMDALQASAGQMGYSLVGFDMMDTDPDPASVQPKGSVWPFPRVHELTPGAVLFRRASDPSDASKRTRLLLILLVGEAATTGVHQEALANALDLALLWQKPADTAAPDDHVQSGQTGQTGRRDHAVRVLGPTYSGSAIPLREALDDAVSRHGLPKGGPAWFDVVTGSASSPDNRDRLAVEGVSTFRSVVRSDPEALTAVARFLGQSRREWSCGNHVALLVEGNTTWGRSIIRSSSQNQCGECNSNPIAYSKAPLPCATIVPFPLHISRLRDAAQHNTAVAGAVASESTVALDLSESVQPGDLVPSETPQMTSASVETQVSGMMRMLRDRKISAVGVLATDKRDHIYLAEEIARLHPNVLPFTIESALMYLHPDVNGYMRGTVVASTYSLNERTQRFTQFPEGQHYPLQFSTSPAQGNFNALAMLLGRADSLVDYESPVMPGRGAPAVSGAPPVWISVVGRSVLLPVKGDSSGACGGYVACTGPGTPTTQLAPAGSARTYSYLVARHLILFLGAALALVFIAYQVRVQIRLETLRPCAPSSTPPEPPILGCDLGAPTPVQRMNADASAYLHAIRNWLRSLLKSPEVHNTCAVEISAGLLAMRAATVVVLLGLAKLGAISVADGFGLPLLPFQSVFVVGALLGTLYLLWQAGDTFWVKRNCASRQLHGARAAALLAVGSVLAYGALQNEAIAIQWSAAHGIDPAGYGWLLALAGVFALAAMLLDWDDTIGTPVGLISRWRRFPVLLGLLAFLWLDLDLACRHWSDVEALLYADRTAAMSSLLSPAANVLFITLAIFSWGGWAISRVGLLRLPETEIGVGPLIEHAAGRAGINPSLAFQEPAMTTGTLVAAPTLAVLLALTFGSSHSGSIEGYAFGYYLLFSATAVIAVLTHTLANSTYLGFAVVYLLRCLAHHPGSSTFKKLARDAISWRLSFQRVRMIEMVSLLRRLERVERQRVEVIPPKLISAADTMRAPATPEICPQGSAGTATKPKVVLAKEDWVKINACAYRFYEELQLTKWRPDFNSALMPQSEIRIYDDMEYIVFFHAAIVLRDLLTRLISGFTIVFCGLLALVVSNLLYTFQGRVYWLSFDAIVLALATLIAVGFLSFLERDAILSRLWHTKPGSISLFSGLTWRMAAYAVVLAATLFTVFFPELGGRLSSWLVPARSLIE